MCVCVRVCCVALIVLSHWYVAAQDRKLWHDRYCAGMERAVEWRIVSEWKKRKASSLLGGSSALPFTCHQCNRSFRRTGDLRRHKCDSRRSRARLGAQGADELQCRTCHRTFRRKKCESSLKGTFPAVLLLTSHSSSGAASSIS